MHPEIVKLAAKDERWQRGFINHKDSHCVVMCDCGNDLDVSDSKIFECPRCHRGYITEFICYRIPAKMVTEAQEYLEG